MQKFSYLTSTNSEFIDDVFEQYLKNPNSVDDSWRYFFEGIELGIEEARPHGTSEVSANISASVSPAASQLEFKTAELILTYRHLAKHQAQIDPLSPPPPAHPALELSRFGITAADLSQTVSAGKLLGMAEATIAQIVDRLKTIYCSTIGFEIAQIENQTERQWLLDKVEIGSFRQSLSADDKKFILKRLTETEGFERFLHTRYVAQKRFSVEGGDGLIPMLDFAIEKATDMGAIEVVIGMAHRGRLNVLVHTLGKKYENLLVEFEGNYKVDLTKGEGDVKYHKGYSKDFTTRKQKNVHLSLAFNPSHLEFVNPVIEGMARAKMDFHGDPSGNKIFPIIIHGDTAFAGQGVCYETIQMSQLKGYQTGGTLHIIVNNQVGFTCDPSDSRSTSFCSDVAKLLDSPIFHVNGDDAEALVSVVQLATEYRQKFKKDAFIDVVCYRKHGHNEGDEPSFTQPLLYKKIKAHPSPREVYASKLATQGTVSADEAQAWVDAITAKLTEAQKIARESKPEPVISAFEGRWKGFKFGEDKDIFAAVKTEVDGKTIQEIAQKINTMPADFHLHSKLGRFFEARLKAFQEGKGIDWGNGETMAYATLVHEGVAVRITGQDAERGTFTHRHSVVTDFEDGKKYSPINVVAKKPAKYEVYNSFLSETAVMGYEYGYSIAEPSALVIWEAQFGDFANGAQVIIDQFLSASESKWLRSSGIVLLLPHGYEGQGPEHSSARLERFLQLCGRCNMIVLNLTTPAQIFHALRRQVKRDFRKPMIVMSPKSLLRHPLAVSTLDDFSKAGFQEVIPDLQIKKAKRILICTGKIYYELLNARAERKIEDVAIVRLEQMYPFPADALAEVLTAHKEAKEYFWVQEEPRNMGAWTFIFSRWMGGLANFSEKVGGKSIRFVGRDTAASPAVGSPKVHEVQQKAIIEESFT